MVKDKFANFWIYSLLSPFESKDYAYTLSITHENGRSKFSHYNAVKTLGRIHISRQIFFGNFGPTYPKIWRQILKISRIFPEDYNFP